MLEGGDRDPTSAEVTDRTIAPRLSQVAAPPMEAAGRSAEEATGLIAEEPPDSPTGFYLTLGVIVAALLLTVIWVFGTQREIASMPGAGRPVALHPRLFAPRFMPRRQLTPGPAVNNSASRPEPEGSPPASEPTLAPERGNAIPSESSRPPGSPLTPAPSGSLADAPQPDTTPSTPRAPGFTGSPSLPATGGPLVGNALQLAPPGAPTAR